MARGKMKLGPLQPVTELVSRTVPSTVSVGVTATVIGGFQNVHGPQPPGQNGPRAAGQPVRAGLGCRPTGRSGRTPPRCRALRWGSLHGLATFATVELPMRVVREKASGHYGTLPRALFCTKPRACFPRPWNSKPVRRPPNRPVVRPRAACSASASGSMSGESGTWSNAAGSACGANEGNSRRPPQARDGLAVLTGEVDPTRPRARLCDRGGPVR